MTLPIIEPVQDANLREFCEFLFEHLSNNRSVNDWVTSFRPPWQFSSPNYGFLIRDSEAKIVGGIGAIYSSQIINGKREQFCNITSWCVVESFRNQSMRLAMAIVGQKGYTITDFSPTRVVSDTLRFLKFRPLDERVTIFANLPAVGFSRKSIFLHDRDLDIQQKLDGAELQIYLDHRIFPWLHHLLVEMGGEFCHVIYKLTRLKGLPTAKIIYIGNTELFSKIIKTVSIYFLVNKRLPVSMVETRFLHYRPRVSRQSGDYVPKNYYSEHLSEADINYLYSETMCMDLI